MQEEQENCGIKDDIKATFKCIYCVRKQNSFTSNLLNHLFSEMGVLHCTTL